MLNCFFSSKLKSVFNAIINMKKLLYEQYNISTYTNPVFIPYLFLHDCISYYLD